MADYASSLPIRTESAGDAIVKICDATTESQQLKVNANGSIDTNITGSDIDIRDLVFATDKVDVSGSSVTVTATNLDVRDLVFATDKVDVSGSSISATDLDIRDLVFATDKVDVSGSSVTVTATNLDVRDLVFATDKVDVSGSSITATDLDIRDLTHASDSVKVGDGTDFLAINTDGSINVKIVDNSPGTAINDYNTSASLAAAASNTHTYTSTGDFYLQQIFATGSAKIKIVVSVNSVVKFVGFNSTANPNIAFTFSQPLLATTGQTVTVARTNLDNQAQDVYSTICGYNA